MADGRCAADCDRLEKVYVEPTNDCNLDCRTCVRHSWDEQMGSMDWATYERLIDDLAAFPEMKTVAFMGLGEPLMHPRFADMVRLAHARGYRTEVTTNALLLDEAMADSLLAAGLDQLVVSVDGASAERFGDVRSGASLARVVENVRRIGFLYRDASFHKPRVRVGLEFVAMRSNVHELPRLNDVAAQIGASFIIVTNVLPYTPDLVQETLFDHGVTGLQGPPIQSFPRWHLPRMDVDDDTAQPLMGVLRKAKLLTYIDIDLDTQNDTCPFLRRRSVAVGWEGSVTPCPPLLHSYTCYVLGREKRITRHAVGRIGESPLRAIWDAAPYAGFRRRLAAFAFPPCTDCGGCELAEGNEEDCFGNLHPVCGDCLWARGIVRCA
jgi:MoaA/NifB/PqqE/SkfB family radical SAM enzyme